MPLLQQQRIARNAKYKVTKGGYLRVQTTLKAINKKEESNKYTVCVYG